MPRWNIGDRVQVVDREVTKSDRDENMYYSHMAGLVGEVQSVYGDEVAVRVDLDCLENPAKDVHKVATKQLREKFAGAVSEEQKKLLSKEEMSFVPNYVLLVRSEDLKKAP